MLVEIQKKGSAMESWKSKRSVASSPSIHTLSANTLSVIPWPFVERLILYDIHQSTQATTKSS
jgi:hypothetical protein